MAQYLTLFISILAIVNPLGAVPLFLTATLDETPEKRRRTARIAATTVFLTLLGAAWAGELVLRFLGIGIPAFRVGGGILILLMAISMLEAKTPSAKNTPEEEQEAVESENVGVVPLGIPLLSGPGSIALVIVSAHQNPFWPHLPILSVLILGVATVTWLTLNVATIVGRKLGRTGINIGTRLMGLVLAATGVEFISGGLRELFPIFAGAATAGAGS